jgi:pre-60S factor REI1
MRTYFSENAYQNHLGSQKHKANLSRAGEAHGDDEASSVMSSTFSLGEPMVVKDEEIDSEAEEEFNEVVEGIKKTNLKDIPPATRRPSRPHHSALVWTRWRLLLPLLPLLLPKTMKLLMRLA